MDIWPLYLYHDNAQTLNVAINLRAYCTVERRHDGTLRLQSDDTGATAEAGHWSQLPDRGELRLLGRIVKFFDVSGVTITTHSESPFGAGIAGSSALNVAVCAALNRWTRCGLEAEALLDVAKNVEAQAIDVPTGVQDYRPAMYGGISAIELGAGGILRVPLDVDPSDLESRIVLAYTMATRNSGINNWEVTKRHVDGDREVVDAFARIRDTAVRMRLALERGDWSSVGRELAIEWDNRKRLAPGVTTESIDRLIGHAMDAGALAAKVCGAGGGGCLICFCEPDHRDTVAQALADGGAQVLPFRVDREGLRLAVHG